MIPEHIRHKLRTIDSIATLPHIATEILSMMRNNNATMRHIAVVIEQDPSVTAKILKVANSPLWGYSGRVENVQRALVMLGLKQVSNIVIAISLYSTFAKLKPNPFFDRAKFWLHSVGTAQVARKFTSQIGLHFHGEEFVAGLLHDLGKMVLDQFWGDLFQEIIQEARETSQPIFSVEQKRLGCSHAEIGAYLLQNWNFPSSIVNVLAYHHTPQLSEGYRDLVGVIHISEILCELWGVGFDEDLESSSPYDNPSWQFLRQHSPKLSVFDLERFVFEMNTEMDNAQLFLNLVNE